MSGLRSDWRRIWRVKRDGIGSKGAVGKRLRIFSDGWRAGLSAGFLQGHELLQGSEVSAMMRGLVAQIEREGFWIFDVAGLQIDGALGEPVALSHVVNQDALGARGRLELVVEIVHQLDPLIGIFAGKQDEDGGEAGETMGAGVLAGAILACGSTRTGAVAGRCNVTAPAQARRQAATVYRSDSERG